jgi:hypothetical protein
MTVTGGMKVYRLLGTPSGIKRRKRVSQAVLGFQIIARMPPTTPNPAPTIHIQPKPIRNARSEKRMIVTPAVLRISGFSSKLAAAPLRIIESMTKSMPMNSEVSPAHALQLMAK